jgi:hypothetical protein
MSAVMMEDQAPAMVKFELRAVEDGIKTKEAGRRITKDAEFIIIIPPGGNLIVEKEIRDSNRNEIMSKYGRQYEAWKAGIDPSVEGTSLREWPLASPSQCENLASCKVYSVEQLAQAPEDVLNVIGMGARGLKQKAIAWLESAQNVGKIAAKLEALENDMKALKADNAEKDNYIRQLEGELEKKGRRKRKIE